MYRNIQVLSLVLTLIATMLGFDDATPREVPAYIMGIVTLLIIINFSMDDHANKK